MSWASGGSWSRTECGLDRAGRETVYDGEHLTLVDLGADVTSETRGSGSTTLIVLGHILVTGMLLGSLFLLGFRAGEGRRRVTPTR